MGKRIVFDCVDNFLFDTHPPYAKGKELVDVFITNNARHREFVTDKLRLEPSRVIVIEHYHSNVRRVLKPWIGLNTVGYVGQEYYCTLGTPFFEQLKQRGITFHWGNPNVLGDDNAVAETSKMDCFIVYFRPPVGGGEEDQAARQVLEFKPAQKILLPFSLGIPTIFSPYYSYMAAIEKTGLSAADFLVVNSEDDVLRHIDWLRDAANAGEVEQLIRRQQRVAENFSLDRVLAKYESALHP